MSAVANNFLDRLEQLGILDDEVLARARRRVAESRSVVRADDVAKMLIDGGHLTKSQAKKLLGQADEQPTPTKPTPAKSPPKPAAPESEEDLGLADLDDHPGEEKTPSVAAATATKSTAPAEKPKPSSLPADKAASKSAKSTTDKKGAQPGAEDIIVLEEGGGLWSCLWCLPPIQAPI